MSYIIFFLRKMTANTLSAFTRTQTWYVKIHGMCLHAFECDMSCSPKCCTTINNTIQKNIMQAAHAWSMGTMYFLLLFSLCLKYVICAMYGIVQCNVRQMASVFCITPGKMTLLRLNSQTWNFYSLRFGKTIASFKKCQNCTEARDKTLYR